jgi:hypothetical protein
MQHFPYLSLENNAFTEMKFGSLKPQIMFLTSTLSMHRLHT